MTRRALLGGMAAMFAPKGNPLVLEAIAAEKMPHQLIVHGVMPAQFFEVRDYGLDAHKAATVLARHGVVCGQTSGKLMLSFESLAAREAAWRGVTADPEWVALQRSVELKEISLYRVAG